MPYTLKAKRSFSSLLPLDEKERENEKEKVEKAETNSWNYTSPSPHRVRRACPKRWKRRRTCAEMLLQRRLKDDDRCSMVG
jgi:hypothetical protein